MAVKRTAEGWTQYLAGTDRDLTLEEFVAMESQHVCDHTREILQRVDKTMLEIEQLNAMLRRLEKFLAAATSYPQPALTNGRSE